MKWREGGSFGLRTEREVRVLYEGGNGCGVSGFGRWLIYFQTTTKSRHIGKWNGGIGSHEVLTSRSIISHFWSGVK